MSEKENSYSLLVVEDNDFNRDLIVRHLGKEGYDQLEAAENGQVALEMLRKKPFDLVLLDIEMPVLDGIGVLEALKSDMRLRDVPVLMISGVEEQDSVVKCIELGAEDSLPKPFDPVLLRARLGACLEKKRLSDERNSFMQQIKTEKQRSDDLLNVILPSAAANELRTNGTVQPRRFDNVAVLFCDIVGFTSYCDGNSPEVVVGYLQSLFKAFEAITDEHGMEKIKTIGDEFMASAGLLRQCPDPLLSAVRCGLAMGQASKELEPHWDVRVGVNIGSIVAGVVGDQKYQFDVWGDTVNVAARMAGVGSASTVCMIHDAWLRVENDCDGRSLGRVEVKGKGEVEVIECYGLR